jgi:hypothetical protein
MIEHHLLSEKEEKELVSRLEFSKFGTELGDLCEFLYLSSSKIVGYCNLISGFLG